MKLIVTTELSAEAAQFLTPPYSIFDGALPILMDYCLEKYGDTCLYVINQSIAPLMPFNFPSSKAFALVTSREVKGKNGVESIKLDYVFLDKLVAYLASNHDWSFSSCLKAIIEKKKDDYNEIGYIKF